MADERIVAESQSVKVFLRLRPLNRFETSKRSRSAVEVLSEQRLAIDDPLQGDWEIDFDGVRVYVRPT
jgi:hypothetical protein